MPFKAIANKYIDKKCEKKVTHNVILISKFRYHHCLKSKCYYSCFKTAFVAPEIIPYIDSVYKPKYVFTHSLQVLKVPPGTGIFTRLNNSKYSWPEETKAGKKNIAHSVIFTTVNIPLSLLQFTYLAWKQNIFIFSQMYLISHRLLRYVAVTVFSAQMAPRRSHSRRYLPTLVEVNVSEESLAN